MRSTSRPYGNLHRDQLTTMITYALIYHYDNDTRHTHVQNTHVQNTGLTFYLVSAQTVVDRRYAHGQKDRGGADSSRQCADRVHVVDRRYAHAQKDRGGLY